MAVSMKSDRSVALPQEVLDLIKAAEACRSLLWAEAEEGPYTDKAADLLDAMDALRPKEHQRRRAQ